MENWRQRRRREEGKGTHRLGVLDEGLGSAHLPLLLGDTRVLQDPLTSRLGVSLPGVLSSVRRSRREEVEPTPQRRQ